LSSVCDLTSVCCSVCISFLFLASSHGSSHGIMPRNASTAASWSPSLAWTPMRTKCTVKAAGSLFTLLCFSSSCLFCGSSRSRSSPPSWPPRSWATSASSCGMTAPSAVGPARPLVAGNVEVPQLGRQHRRVPGARRRLTRPGCPRQRGADQHGGPVLLPLLNCTGARAEASSGGAPCGTGLHLPLSLMLFELTTRHSRENPLRK
jgi:hypothetical protein